MLSVALLERLPRQSAILARITYDLLHLPEASPMFHGGYFYIEDLIEIKV